MSKINSARKYQMPHGLHLKFMIAVLVVLLKYEISKVKMKELIDKFSACVDKEDLCYKNVRKSDLSTQKAEKDHERDDMVIGVKNVMKTALFHYDPRVREAARRLKIVFDTFNRPMPIVNQPYEVETVTIKNFIHELETKYAEDIKIIGLVEWLTELAVRNEIFDRLTIAHHEEKAERNPLRPKEVRRDTDEAYNNIIETIEGLIHLETIQDYAALVSELNELVNSYNSQLAQHLGRLHAKKEREKEAEAETEEKEDEDN
ncbi:MAG: DUF6261 family protein [Bacteroidales bacterium]|jgi:hypothetical protein|nr:DUF6261 family protein [Bacteroidales bacterium]